MTTRIRRHVTTVLAAALVLAGALAACTPQPAPQPSPTGFASEEEAFAAAEATYRAYVDAVNARRADENSTPDPTEFLIGDALSSELEAAGIARERGVRVEGESVIVNVTPREASSEAATIVACLDSSRTTILNASDTDVTPPDRSTKLSVAVTVVYVSDDAPVISSAVAEDYRC